MDQHNKEPRNRPVNTQLLNVQGRNTQSRGQTDCRRLLGKGAYLMKKTKITINTIYKRGLHKIKDLHVKKESYKINITKYKRIFL